MDSIRATYLRELLIAATRVAEFPITYSDLADRAVALGSGDIWPPTREEFDELSNAPAPGPKRPPLMTGEDHYREAERLLRSGTENSVRKAQVHATLALVAATVDVPPATFLPDPDA